VDLLTNLTISKDGPFPPVVNSFIVGMANWPAAATATGGVVI
jgi:hypothetical protein